TALDGNLQPAQRTRLAQIQFQVKGPVAFLDEDLPQRLGLTDEQRAAVQKLAQEAREAIFAAVVRTLPPGVDQTSTVDDIRTFVASEAFRSSENEAIPPVLEIWTKAVAKIEEALTEEQRLRYRELRGVAFDVGKLLSEADDDPVARVAASLGLTGQRSDPDFDVSVARPAYPDLHPSVLFDEGHRNFHTAGGRYKPFVNLITNDGYRVTPGQSPFIPELLASHQVLIIANATAERSDDGQAPNSAFTDDECRVVEAWVGEGGSLLLITDHEPFGSASKGLAQRFGVDMSTRVADDPENSADAGLLFSREKNLIGDHPITNGRDNAERINRVLTFTGQSLKGPETSVALLKLADTAKESGDEGEVSAAGRSQGLALTYGKGRVVMLGEAAQLSAQMFGFPEPERFGMNVPGCDNRQFALNIMHWLSGLTN
ncbi:MAG TPA: hypothetical protein VG125_01445, partial [Pirellulales bacterium]|nr:hypothetical protein [Pirellulales bacterium]